MSGKNQINDEYPMFLVPEGMEFQGDWLELGRKDGLRSAVRATPRQLWEKVNEQRNEILLLRKKLKEADARVLDIAGELAIEVSAECPGNRYGWESNSGCDDCVGMKYRKRQAACWIEYLDGKESAER